MKLPQIKVIPQEANPLTAGFKGLNKMPVTSPGELTAMTNMFTDYLPCLKNRPPRSTFATLTTGKAMKIANGKFCYVDSTNFKYDGVTKGAVAASAKCMEEYFGIILILPDKKYYNYVTDTFGSIATAPATLSYCCVWNNRAFGIGGNGFYASKLLDPLTWNDFPVPLTEDCSWQTNAGEEGDFTAIRVVQNHVVCAKSKHFYELYGDKPSNFRLIHLANVGCIDNRSMVEIEGVLYFLSSDGFRAYAGSMPKLISVKLNETYTSCVAGTDGRKYYASLYNGTSYSLYVYDTMAGVWAREDDLSVTDFGYLNEFLYALSGNTVYKFNSGTERVEWEFESECFTEWYMGKKINKRISTMVELETNSQLDIYCSVDDGEYSLQYSMSATGFKIYNVDIMPNECDSFKVKFSGKGGVKIYGFSRDVLPGGN